MGSGVGVCAETGSALEDSSSTLSPPGTRWQCGLSVLLRGYGARDSSASGKRGEGITLSEQQSTFTQILAIFYLSSYFTLVFYLYLFTFLVEVLYLLLHYIYLMPVDSFSVSQGLLNSIDDMMCICLV